MSVIGKLQRTSPLPVGDYWIDVVGPSAQEAFGVWRFEHQTTIQVITTESFEADEGFPSREWVKFRVNAPTPWDAKKIGYPNIIGDGEVIVSSDDTAHNLPTEPVDLFDEGPLNFVPWVVGGAIVALALVVRR